MAEFSEWKSEATPDRASVDVWLDRRLLSEYQEAEQELEKARAALGEVQDSRGEGKSHRMLGGEAESRVQVLEERVETLGKELRTKTLTLVFEGVGRRKWADLKAEHPPTKEQEGEFGDALDVNPETFFAAAMAESCKDPELTVDDAQWMLDTLPEGECVRITMALTKVNYFGSRNPFENGFVEALPSALTSKPQSG